jgi:hypothetical protein
MGEIGPLREGGTIGQVVINRLSDVELESAGVAVIGLDLPGLDSRKGIEAGQDVPGVPGIGTDGVATPRCEKEGGQEGRQLTKAPAMEVR